MVTIIALPEDQVVWFADLEIFVLVAVDTDEAALAVPALGETTAVVDFDAVAATGCRVTMGTVLALMWPRWVRCQRPK